MLKTLQRRDNLSVKAKRVEHLRIEILVVSLEMVAQMLNPYTDMAHLFCPV